ncbi:MAG: CocE/NonD family hydrolase, partial [Candidatus Saccharibacteria bacterium]|nr:CocE/NonD family hydrolase [Pseudorhodobacter sp.]
VGPWVHQYPHVAPPGPQVGFLQMAVRWWDRWLKGVANGVEDDPAYRAYMLHSAAPDASAAFRPGHWVAGEWPSPSVSVQVLYLGAAGDRPGGFTPPGPKPQTQIRVCGGVEYLSQCEGDFRGVIATPQHLGMAAGEFFPMGLNAEMAGDQRGDDALSLCFDGDVLEAGLELLGAARVVLRVASDRPLGFVVARLCDVGPDGSSVRIAHGMRNLCHRESMEAPAVMVPGVAVKVAFDLDEMAYRLAPGHRLRLALSNSYWPFVWPSPQAGELTVTGGRLEVPVHQGPTAGWEPPVAEGAPAWNHRVLRKGASARRVEEDLLTGVRALVVEEDGGEVENLDHGLRTSEVMTERWEIGADPLSAKAVHVWEQGLARGDWAVRTLVETEMTGDATHLRMVARLTAWEGDRVIFERSHDEKVARRFV